LFVSAHLFESKVRQKQSSVAILALAKRPLLRNADRRGGDPRMGRA
jgi:hypothetical protein